MRNVRNANHFHSSNRTILELKYLTNAQLALDAGSIYFRTSNRTILELKYLTNAR